MYKLAILLLLIPFGLKSCNSKSFVAETRYGGWQENSINFIYSFPQVDTVGGYLGELMYQKWGGLSLRNSNQKDIKPFSWLRNAGNLQIAHNTIKKIGYKNFVSIKEYNTPMKFQEIYGGMERHDWEGYSVSQIVDSLLITYKQPKKSEGYFQNFWKRRKSEGTDQTLFSILNEVKKEYARPNIKKPQENLKVNDTLESLLRFDTRLQKFGNKPNEEFLWDYFTYLKSIGLRHSAYNLVVEKYPIQVQPDSINKVLGLKIVSDDEYWRTRNDASWIYTYGDNGP